MWHAFRYCGSKQGANIKRKDYGPWVDTHTYFMFRDMIMWNKVDLLIKQFDAWKQVLLTSRFFLFQKNNQKNTFNVQKALCVHWIIQPPSAMRDDGFILAKRKIDFLTQEMKFSERTRERERENITIQSCTQSKLVKCLFFQLIYGKIIW